jgi:hypothetical protein
MAFRSCLAATAFFALGLISCAPTETRVVRVIDTAGLPAHPWIGKPESLVLETWGPNPARESDGQGGSILSYTGSPELHEVPSELSRPVPSGSPDTVPPSPYGSEIVRVKPKTSARFWVDARGLVYRVWFAPSVYKKGKDTPGGASDTER